MKFKVGDLAIVVHGEPAWIGWIVEVIRIEPADIMFDNAPYCVQCPDGMERWGGDHELAPLADPDKAETRMDELELVG